MTDGSSRENDFARFPATRRSAVLDLASGDAATRARSFEIVTRAYYRPVYSHVRLRFRKPADEAAELTQAFFAEAFERRTFDRYDPEKAHFRTFLKLCLERFAGRVARDKRRLKRGGGASVLSLDFEGAEAFVARAPDVDPDAAFEEAWLASVLSIALDRLRDAARAKGKVVQLAIFEAVAVVPDDAEKPSYADLALKHGVAITDVTNYLSAMRRELRKILLETLRELTANEEELALYAKALVGSGA